LRGFNKKPNRNAKVIINKFAGKYGIKIFLSFAWKIAISFWSIFYRRDDRKPQASKQATTSFVISVVPWDHFVSTSQIFFSSFFYKLACIIHDRWKIVNWWDSYWKNLIVFKKYFIIIISYKSLLPIFFLSSRILGLLFLVKFATCKVTQTWLNFVVIHRDCLGRLEGKNNRIYIRKKKQLRKVYI